MDTSKKVYFDACVMLELVFNRSKTSSVITLIQNQANDVYISALTVHLVMHFGLKTGLTLTTLKTLLDDFEILPITVDDVELAFQICQDKDFEDALQIACAINNICDKFITLDKDLTKRYQHILTIERL